MSLEFDLPFHKWQEKHRSSQYVYLADLWYDIELPYRTLSYRVIFDISGHQWSIDNENTVVKCIQHDYSQKLVYYKCYSAWYVVEYNTPY